MKRIILIKTLIICLLIIAFASCSRKASISKSRNATITAIDGRKCASPMCGGYFIKIDGEKEIYRTLGFPENFQITKWGIPLRVAIEYRSATCTNCPDNLIEITKINVAE